MSADGTGVRQCTQSRGRNTSPKWSPDGKRISFDHASQGECDIFVIDAPQKQAMLAPFARFCLSPAWLQLQSVVMKSVGPHEMLNFPLAKLSEFRQDPISSFQAYRSESFLCHTQTRKQNSTPHFTPRS